MNNSHHHITLCTLVQSVSCALLVVAFVLFFTGDAQANVICNAATLIQSHYARGAIAIGVLLIGAGAILGKVSLTQAAIVAIGIAILVGAGAITTSLLYTTGNMCGMGSI